MFEICLKFCVRTCEPEVIGSLFIIFVYIFTSNLKRKQRHKSSTSSQKLIKELHMRHYKIKSHNNPNFSRNKKKCPVQDEAIPHQVLRHVGQHLYKYTCGFVFVIKSLICNHEGFDGNRFGRFRRRGSRPSRHQIHHQV